MISSGECIGAIIITASRAMAEGTEAHKPALIHRASLHDLLSGGGLSQSAMPSVLVDDSTTMKDGIPLIVYGGSAPWQRNGRAGLENDGTTHGATVAGSWAAFQFTGTQISVFGTLDPPGANPDRAAPDSQYTIDGQNPLRFNRTGNPITPSTSVTFNNTFFQSPTLSQGQHTLLIEVLNVNTGHNYWLDYLVYQTDENPPPDVSSLTPVDGANIDPGAPYTVVVDDSNTTAINYVGSWGPNGIAGQEFNGTTHGADAGGFNATFVFAGSQVSVFGTLDAPGGSPNQAAPRTAFSVDGGTPSFFNSTGNATAFSGASAKNVSFFSSPTLNQGIHTLSINVQTVDPGHNFWLDYITYQTNAKPPPPPEPSPTASTTDISNISATGGAQPTQTGAGSNASSTASAGSSNGGAIAGGVVGGLAGLALVALAVLLLLRRRRKQEKLEPIDEFPASYGGTPGSNTGKPSEQPSQSNYTSTPYNPYSSGSEMVYAPGAGAAASSYIPSHSSGPSQSNYSSPPSNAAGGSRGPNMAAVAGTSRNVGEGPSPPAYEVGGRFGRALPQTPPEQVLSDAASSSAVFPGVGDRKDPRLFTHNQ